MIRGDSSEYDLIELAIKEYKPVADTYYSSIEIGVREGLGSQIIMDSFHKFHKDRPYYHIGVDPYGNLKYKHYDNNDAYTADYTNDMYEMCKKDFVNYRNFFLLKMTDRDYMTRFSDGLPIYEEKEMLISKYDFIHLDGPHTTIAVLEETFFFLPRLKSKGIIVFDDYVTFDFTAVDMLLSMHKCLVKYRGNNKIIYEKA